MIMIELGLGRVAQLVKHTPLTWKAIHVAGTNGKGSITAFISAILKESGVLTGRFNSPHLIDRWDSISIQDRPISKSTFCRIEEEVKTRNETQEINASEFELLTAIAFEAFNHARVQVGVVEVGLGGRMDATNILKPQDVLVSVISKIGLDHQSFLGHSLKEIAGEKAGIMKKGVPCIVDGSNDPSVLEVLSHHAGLAKAELSVVTPQTDPKSSALKLLNPLFAELNMAAHQRANLLVAVEALKRAESSLGLKSPVEESLHVVSKIAWPGRLQTINLKPFLGRDFAALVDGAHNLQSAEVLSTHVEERIRQRCGSVTWILAVSKGKDVDQLVSCLVKPQDKIVATTFGPVDGMPWVEPAPTEEIVQAATRFAGHVTATESGGIEEVLQSLSEIPSPDPVVIAGSLYLVSDVLRLLRDHNQPDT